MSDGIQRLLMISTESAFGQAFYPALNFDDGYHTDRTILLIGGIQPFKNGCVGTLLPGFGDDVRVQQPSHKFLKVVFMSDKLCQTSPFQISHLRIQPFPLEMKAGEYDRLGY